MKMWMKAQKLLSYQLDVIVSLLVNWFSAGIITNSILTNCKEKIKNVLRVEPIFF